MCPILSTTGLWECLARECAWYDETDYCCAIITIADSLANIHAHARDCFAKAYGLDEDTEDEED